VDAAFRIHTTLGSGLLESVYDTVLAYELGRWGLRTVCQQPIPVVYENSAAKVRLVFASPARGEPA
jgi:GxxExxY protein